MDHSLYFQSVQMQVIVVRQKSNFHKMSKVCDLCRLKFPVAPCIQYVFKFTIIHATMYT